MRRSTESALSRTTAEIMWDPIATIEPLPPEPVYDIEVEGTHNFVANGLVAHNTRLGTLPDDPAAAPPPRSTGPNISQLNRFTDGEKGTGSDLPEGPTAPTPPKPIRGASDGDAEPPEEHLAAPEPTDAEPQLRRRNRYADVLRHLVSGPRVTGASLARRRLLTMAGPQIEAVVRRVMDNDQIKIAMAPIGSTLKGYAADGSDVEYGLYILDDGTEHAMAVDDKQRTRIFHEAAGVLQEIASTSRLTVEADEHMDAWSTIRNFADATRGLLHQVVPVDRAGLQKLIRTGEWSWLFLPVAYADKQLLARARANFLAFLTEREGGQDAWSAIQQSHLTDVAIEQLVIPEKPHLQAWLEAQGVNLSDPRALDEFEAARREELALPSLAQMSHIYGRDPRRPRSSGATILNSAVPSPDAGTSVPPTAPPAAPEAATDSGAQVTQEVSGAEDWDAAKGVKDNQVEVAGHEVVGMAGEGALKQGSVLGVSTGRDAFSRMNNQAGLGDDREQLAAVGGIESLTPLAASEHGPQLPDERRRGDHLELGSDQASEDRTGTAPTKGAEQDVSVEDGAHGLHGELGRQPSSRGQRGGGVVGRVDPHESTTGATAGATSPVPAVALTESSSATTTGLPVASPAAPSTPAKPSAASPMSPLQEHTAGGQPRQAAALPPRPAPAAPVTEAGPQKTEVAEGVPRLSDRGTPPTVSAEVVAEADRAELEVEQSAEVSRCVTGDTLLPIRRMMDRRSWIVDTARPPSTIHDSPSMIQFLPITQVQPGDQVLSLNETTGRLEWRRIKGLLPQGTRPVYRLTTASGKTIRTTGNHPYLTKSGWRQVRNLRVGEAIAVASVGVGEDIEADARQDRHMPVQGRLRRSAERMSNRLRDGLRDGGMDLDVEDPASRRRLKPQEVMIPGENEGLLRLGAGQRLTVAGPWGASQHLVSGRTQEALRMSGDILVEEEFHRGGGLIRGKRHKLAVFELLGRQVERGSDVFGGQLWKVILGEDLVDGDASLQEFQNLPDHNPRALEARLAMADLGIHRDVLLDQVHGILPLSPSLTEKHTTPPQVRQGTDGSDTTWDAIITIEPLPPEPVYDIEVEDTHNFVANGILAHNTSLHPSPPPTPGSAAPAAESVPGSERPGSTAPGPAAPVPDQRELTRQERVTYAALEALPDDARVSIEGQPPIDKPRLTVLAHEGGVFFNDIEPQPQWRFAMPGGGAGPVWKPSGTAEEVNAFAAGSTFSEILWHGTLPERGAQLISQGFDLARHRGLYGQGIYLTPNESEAYLWGRRAAHEQGQAGSVEPVLLRVKVNIRNPKWIVLDSPEAIEQFYYTYAHQPSQSLNLIQQLQAQGHDSLILEFQRVPVDSHSFLLALGGNQVIVFDPKNIMIINDLSVSPPPIAGGSHNDPGPRSGVGAAQPWDSRMAALRQSLEEAGEALHAQWQASIRLLEGEAQMEALREARVEALKAHGFRDLSGDTAAGAAGPFVPWEHAGTGLRLLQKRTRAAAREALQDLIHVRAQGAWVPTFALEAGGWMDPVAHFELDLSPLGYRLLREVLDAQEDQAAVRELLTHAGAAFHQLSGQGLIHGHEHLGNLLAHASTRDVRVIDWKMLSRGPVHAGALRPQDDARAAGARLDADWRGATTPHRFFVFADAREVDFEGAAMAQADFLGADLRRANFADASLGSANFEYADLRGARGLQTARLGGVLLYATVVSEEVMPILAQRLGAKFRQGWMGQEPVWLAATPSALQARASADYHTLDELVRDGLLPEKVPGTWGQASGRPRRPPSPPPPRRMRRTVDA